MKSARNCSKRKKRLRRPGDSLPLRRELIDRLQQQFATIRTIKVKDTGILFIARIKTCTGRTVHRTAYSLPNLAQRLYEGLSGDLC